MGQGAVVAGVRAGPAPVGPARCVHRAPVLRRTLNRRGHAVRRHEAPQPPDASDGGIEEPLVER
jgi:hypothetical protein